VSGAAKNQVEVRARGIHIDPAPAGKLRLPITSYPAPLEGVRGHKPELLALLIRQPFEVGAWTLRRLCKEHLVGLRVEQAGTLVVTSNGRAWRSLFDAIEANVDVVAELILAGWDGSDA
jgi:hypothetical protein